jgi:ubiquinone biosynthesis protein
MRSAAAFLDYPFQLSELLEEFKDGEVRITVQAEGFTEATEKMEAASHRLSIAILAAALLMGSAVVGALVRDGPSLFGLALVAVPGFVIAAGFAIWLILGVIRSGRW